MGFLQNHHIMKVKFKAALHAAKNPLLVVPSTHRWGSLIGCFRSLIKADEVLSNVVSHWKFETVGTSTTKPRKQCQQVKELDLSKSFMYKLKKNVETFAPIDWYITLFQSNNIL